MLPSGMALSLFLFRNYVSEWFRRWLLFIYVWYDTIYILYLSLSYILYTSRKARDIYFGFYLPFRLFGSFLKIHLFQKKYIYIYINSLEEHANQRKQVDRSGVAVSDLLGCITS